MTDRRTALEEIRDLLSTELRGAAGRDAAAIAKELRATWAELDALPVPDSAAPADEIARRRDERRRKASGE